MQGSTTVIRGSEWSSKIMEAVGKHQTKIHMRRRLQQDELLLSLSVVLLLQLINMSVKPRSDYKEPLTTYRFNQLPIVYYYYLLCLFSKTTKTWCSVVVCESFRSIHS